MVLIFLTILFLSVSIVSPKYYLFIFSAHQPLQCITKTLNLASLGIPCMCTCFFSSQLSLSSCIPFFPKYPFFFIRPASNNYHGKQSSCEWKNKQCLVPQNDPKILGPKYHNKNGQDGELWWNWGRGGWPLISTYNIPPLLGNNGPHCIKFPQEMVKLLLNLNHGEPLALLK